MQHRTQSSCFRFSKKIFEKNVNIFVLYQLSCLVTPNHSIEGKDKCPSCMIDPPLSIDQVNTHTKNGNVFHYSIQFEKGSLIWHLGIGGDHNSRCWLSFYITVGRDMTWNFVDIWLDVLLDQEWYSKCASSWQAMRLRHFIGQGKFEALKLILFALATDNLQLTISKKQKHSFFKWLHYIFLIYVSYDIFSLYV